jgi:hypothetical protein
MVGLDKLREIGNDVRKGWNYQPRQLLPLRTGT